MKVDQMSVRCRLIGGVIYDNTTDEKKGKYRRIRYNRYGVKCYKTWCFKTCYKPIMDV